MAAPTPLPKLLLRMGAWDEAIKTLAALKEGGLTVSNVVVDSDNSYDLDEDVENINQHRDGAALLTEVYKVLVPGGTVDVQGSGDYAEWWYFINPPTAHETGRLFFDGRAYDFANSSDDEDFDHNAEDMDAGVAALQAVDQTQALYLMSAGLNSFR